MYRCANDNCRAVYPYRGEFGKCPSCTHPVMIPVEREPLSVERIERLNERLQPRHECAMTWQIAIRDWKRNRNHKKGALA